jgi:pilus assembly protein CpaD
MTHPTHKRTPALASPRSVVTRLALVSLAAIAVAACRPDYTEPEVAGWTLIDPAQRHPILVSRQPSTLNLSVPAGSYGLGPAQRERLSRFLAKYRARDAGNSKVVIASPRGSRNEVAAIQAVAEVRHMMNEFGFDPSIIHVEAYPARGSRHAPIKVSYLRYVAEAPECGSWPTNLANEPANLAYPNFGCATQRNLAVSVANPADLLGPRGETPRAGERRTVVWDKYIKGESTTANKKEDERVRVKGAN